MQLAESQTNLWKVIFGKLIYKTSFYVACMIFHWAGGRVNLRLQQRGFKAKGGVFISCTHSGL